MPLAPSAGPSAPVQVLEKSFKRPPPGHPVYANNYNEVPGASKVPIVQPTFMLLAQAPEMLPRGLPDSVAHPIYNDYGAVPHIPQLDPSHPAQRTIPVNMRDLQDAVPPAIAKPFGSQVGCPSDEGLEVLNKAFSDLNMRVKQLAQETGPCREYLDTLEPTD